MGVIDDHLILGGVIDEHLILGQGMPASRVRSALGWAVVRIGRVGPPLVDADAP
jgi:hypothetical protein